MARAILLLACAVCAGCSHETVNAECQWPDARGASHLADDVRLVEELAIRFADARGPGEAWRTRRETCESILFAAVAASHAVDLAAVAAARSALDDRPFDWAVNVPMTLLTMSLALVLVRRVRRRFAADERGLALAAILAGTVVLAVIVVIGGQVVAGLIETIRVGNGHLSYRASRIPWPHHRGLTVVIVAAAVGLASVVEAVRPSRRSSKPSRQRWLPGG